MASNRNIALLRGINVGKAKRVAMADLRTLFMDLGYSDIRTVLNSGNVVFSGALKPQETIAAEIEEALVLKLGVAARTLVLSGDELSAIVAGNPLRELATDPARLLVSIVSRAYDRDAIAALCSEDWGREAVALGERAVYVWSPDGVLESRALVALGKQLGDGMTSRNWSTILKLDALCMNVAV
jgi:uncharacterized protein (DUF1697 family)